MKWIEDEIESGRREFIYIIVVIQAYGCRRTALIYNNKIGARSSLKLGMESIYVLSSACPSFGRGLKGSCRLSDAHLLPNRSRSCVSPNANPYPNPLFAFAIAMLYDSLSTPIQFVSASVHSNRRIRATNSRC